MGMANDTTYTQAEQTLIQAGLSTQAALAEDVA